jgi:hypothetical protein
MRAHMTAPEPSSPLVVPDRIWFASTDMKIFFRAAASAGKRFQVHHWLTIGRLFVTPNSGWPRKYTR